MTKREMFETIATINADNAEIVEFCNREIELLNRKSSKNHGMTVVQRANIAVKDAIVSALANAGSPLTVTELIATNDSLRGYTNQKISALLGQLVKEQRVAKTIEKKKSFFSVV